MIASQKRTRPLPGCLPKPLRCLSLVSGQTNETAPISHLDRRRGGLAARGACANRRIANCHPFLQPNYSRYDVVKSGGGMRRQNFPGNLVTTNGARPPAKRNALRHRITMARK